MRGLLAAVLLGACAVSRPERQQSDQRPLSHNERYTNGDITMEADHSLLVYADSSHGSPPQRVRPGEQGYDLFIQRARGLAPGERKRMYTSNGWYRRNADGSFTIEGIFNVGGVGVIASDTMAPGHPAFACMAEILGEPEVDRVFAFLNYDRDLVNACVMGTDPPPAPSPPG